MNLNELLKSESSSIQVVVSIADLKEFALAIVDEVSASDSRKKGDDQLISRKGAKKMLNVGNFSRLGHIYIKNPDKTP